MDLDDQGAIDDKEIPKTGFWEIFFKFVEKAKFEWIVWKISRREVKL